MNTRQELHQQKMAFKKQQLAEVYGKWPKQHHIRANVGRNHPDYGCTPLEHHRRKEARHVSSS